MKQASNQLNKLLLDLQKLALELEIELKPSLYKNLKKSYAEMKNACSDYRGLLFLLSVLSASTVGAVFLGMSLPGLRSNVNEKYNKYKQFCNDYNGTVTAGENEVCQTFWGQSNSDGYKESWEQLVEECCVIASDVCSELFQDETDNFCNTYANFNGSILALALLCIVGLCVLTCATRYKSSQRGYAYIEDHNPQINLTIAQATNLNEILTSIKAINIPSSSRHDNPITLQLTELTRAIDSIGEVSSASTVYTQQIQTVYQALQSLITKTSSSVNTIISTQWNSQSNTFDNDPEKQAGLEYTLKK